MKKLIFALSFILGGNLLYAQNKNFIDQPYIETTAWVDTLVTPDKIYLSILISESDTKGKQSVEELEKKMAQELKKLGINLEKDLTLSDLSSNFKKYFLRRQDILKSKSYELFVKDAKTAGQVMIALENIGISNVELERTEFSQIEKLKLELRKKAVLKAKEQAESLTGPLDQKVGKVIFISDYNVHFPRMEGRVAGINMAFSDKKLDASQPLPIEFEKIKVQTEINVKFVIE